MRKVVIVFNDLTGGVRTSSLSLASVLSRGASVDVCNFGDFSGGLLVRIFSFLRSILFRSRSDIFIFQHFDAIALGIVLKILGFKRYIFVVHTDLVSYFGSVGLVKRSIIKFLFMLIKDERIVFVSREAQIRASRFFGLSNACCIYNVFSFDVFAKNADANADAVDGINLISVSRLERSKNIDLCIRVVAEVRRLGYPVKLNIYGKGREYDGLKNYIDAIGCGEFVSLMGGDVSKEAIYCGADALISFSNIEGFGLTILESISCSVPIFFTDCSSGPRELMSPDSNPFEKTTSFECTDVGFLVKAPINSIPYSAELTIYEYEYVPMLIDFIGRVDNSGFSMSYDFKRVSESDIFNSWSELLSVL